MQTNEGGPVRLNALSLQDQPDGFLDPTKTVGEIAQTQNIELAEEPKTLSFNPFRRSIPKKQISKKAEQKRKNARKQQKQSRRKNRK